MASLTTDTHLNRILPRLQKMTDELTEWDSKCRLHFNDSKTLVVHFSRKKRNPKQSYD